jgi:nitrogen fixation NifU-like protein
MTATGVDDIYQAAIMDRARRPRHKGLLDVSHVEVQETNPLCGDRVTLTLRWGEGGRIAAVGYHARACAICVAATDLMAEIIPGMAADEARQAAKSFEHKLRTGELIEETGVLAVLRPFQPLRDVPSRIGCATLGWRALVAALAAPTPMAPSAAQT